MSAAELRKNRLCALWLLSVIVVFSLGCFAMEFHVTYEEDGSGLLTLDGLVGTMPESTSDIAKGLADKGWKRVSVNPAGENRVGISAEYPFDATQEIAPLREYFRDATLKGESAENGDKYYTWTSKVDFSAIEAQWKAFEADFAANGIKVGEEGAEGFGGLLGVTEVITPEEARALLAAWPKPGIGLKVQLPGNTPVEANEHWGNAQRYMERQDAFTTFLWGVGRPSRDKADLKVVRRVEQHEGAVSAPKLQVLLDRYLAEIPKSGVYQSLVPNTGFEGHINNIMDGILSGASGTDYLAYTCADYQQMVLDWLGGIRTSTDAGTRSLLDGWAYGPIQIQGGAHRAVVIYARGTDWTTKGIVLDPWIFQQPKYFEIGSWWKSLWWWPYAGAHPEVDSDQGSLYPQMSGKPESYPASDPTGDLPKGRAKPSRIIILRCPVTMLLTTRDGRRVGALADGRLVNELGPAASFYPMSAEGKEGDITWTMFLPDVEFNLDIRGKGTGEFHATIVTADGIQSYGAQRILPGGSATIESLGGGRLSAMSLSNGTSVDPRKATADEVRKELGIQAPARPRQEAAATAGIWSLAWSPDGEVIALAVGRTKGAAFEGSVDAVEAAGMRPIGQAAFAQDAPIALAYSPDGRKIAVALGRMDAGKRVGRIAIINAETWTSLGEAGPFPEWAVSLSFSPDGARFAAGSWDGSVTIWDAERAAMLGSASLGGSVWSVAFSPDGRTIACGATGGTAGKPRVVVLDADGRTLSSFDAGAGNSLQVACSSDGSRIAVASADGSVSVRDASTGGALWTVRGHAEAASSIAFSPDGRIVASGGYDRKVCLWDAVSGGGLRTFDGLENPVTCVRFSPDGARVASGGLGQELKLWDVGP